MTLIERCKNRIDGIDAILAEHSATLSQEQIDTLMDIKGDFTTVLNQATEKMVARALAGMQVHDQTPNLTSEASWRMLKICVNRTEGENAAQWREQAFKLIVALEDETRQ